jgi:hypothetical protein
MKNRAGLWIDYRKCVMVMITDDKIEKKIIHSNIEKHLGHIDNDTSTESFESQKIMADCDRERNFTAHLNIYFDEIISYINDAEFILIFGQGEAKAEFAKQINKRRINGQIELLEIADKMTDTQVIAKVKEHMFVSA